MVPKDSEKGYGHSARTMRHIVCYALALALASTARRRRRERPKEPCRTDGDAAKDRCLTPF
ncbi:hypothetical protein B0H12DRAFT_1144092 [Mycena haematopus]|nr:hypothetical protein B0H12DRAFT_1144092 [Mycena haematopus]